MAITINYLSERLRTTSAEVNLMSAIVTKDKDKNLDLFEMITEIKKHSFMDGISFSNNSLEKYKEAINVATETLEHASSTFDGVESRDITSRGLTHLKQLIGELEK